MEICASGVGGKDILTVRIDSEEGKELKKENTSKSFSIIT